MATDDRLDKTISAWLEETAPARLPERVLDATFERTRRTRQQAGWRGWLGRIRIAPFAPALGGAVVVVLAAAVVLTLTTDPVGIGGPAATFDPARPILGTWVSTSDADGGTQAMMVRDSADDGTGDAVSVEVHDTIAIVCSGVPSTMTGSGVIEGDRLIVPTPEYTCDDGSEPEAVSGPPLEEQLLDLTLVYHPDSDTLTDDFGGLWFREGAPNPVLGSWVSTSDGDGGTQTMTVLAAADGVSVEIHDSIATVCSGLPSTMTGSGRIEGSSLIVPTPDYSCDDGSEPAAVSGPPLEEQLRDWTLVYDPESDTLADGFGGVWQRDEGPSPEPTAPDASATPGAAASPSASVASPSAFTERFDSPLHGLSIGYPSGWQTRPATEPWSHDAFTFDAPGVDIIFDPARQDDLYFSLASGPLGGQSAEDWCCSVLWASAEVCETGGNFGRITVDGAEATARGCDGDGNRFEDHVVQIATATHGYVIYLHVADDPVLQATYTEAWFDALLETVDLRPEDAVDAPSPSASP